MKPSPSSSVFVLCSPVNPWEKNEAIPLPLSLSPALLNVLRVTQLPALYHATSQAANQGQETGTGGKSIRPEVPFDLESRKQSGDSQAPAALVWLVSPAASSSAGGRLLDLHLEDCGLPLSLSQMGLPILRVWECSSDPGPSSQMTALPHHWCGVSM